MLKGFGVGRLGSDAELRYLPDATPVLNWRMAFDGNKKDAPPTWVSCALFGKRGESLAKYLTKGSQFGVSGTMSTREYESKGEKRTSIEMRVDDVAFADGKREDGASAGGGNGARTPPPPPADGPPADDSEIPF